MNRHRLGAEALIAFTEALNGGKQLSVAYVVDPRFPGGTSSAVAAELEAVSTLCRLQVYALDSKMFKGRRVANQLNKVLSRLRLPIRWGHRDISADVVILHNPSCLKFQDYPGIRIFARHLVVVTHENFLRPGGAVAFDFEKCLGQLDSNTLALKRSLAPISAWNRHTVETALDGTDAQGRWELLEEDWFNICSFEFSAPTAVPRDRRGRLSRPGREKFPTQDTMALSFPKSSQSNTILGADSLIQAQDSPEHWTLFPFGSLSVDQFFSRVDFMVYFTAPTWRESFGRVIAEAIAAGKIVITDPETAKPFDGGAIAATPDKVDEIIAGYLSQPALYQKDVLKAQEKLGRFSVQAFQDRFLRTMELEAGQAV